MPLFTQYTQPGVYTSVIYEEAGVSLFGDARIPVLLAEGQETRSLPSQELHRGSSSVSDERRVLEDLSHHISGGRSYKVAYGPVVSGSGKGVISNNPGDIEAYTTDAQGTLIPLRVTYLNGATGEFMLETILPTDATLKVSYYFKNQDSPVEEDLSFQVPTYATWAPTTFATVSGGLVLTTSIPGNSGNRLKLAVTLSATGKDDISAITGIGTDTISIEARMADTNGTIRTTAQIKSLIESCDPGMGIPTKSAGLVVVKSMASAAANLPATAVVSTAFSGGKGPNTNKTFRVTQLPIVDGSNGGVALGGPHSSFVATVNGVPASVAAVDGVDGLFTLATGVPAGAVLKVNYYTNRFQDTWDLLPAENVVSIDSVGFAPGHEDFVDTVDFVLYDNKIHWGATVITKQGSSTAGYNPFDASVITPTLVDEKVYLRPCGGAIDGINTTFTLEDVPTDGGQISRKTDNPDLIRVYVGRTPGEALAAGPKRVIRLDGAVRTFALYEPPAADMSVFASYWRNALGDHTYTLKVVTPGITGQGTYTAVDENGGYVPVCSEGPHTVTEADFAVTGIVWPRSLADLRGVPGQSPAETITVKFQDDGLTHQTQAPVQAVCDTAQAGLRFRATLPGVGPNSTDVAAPTAGKPSVRFQSGTAVADSAAIVVTDEAIVINISRDTGASAGGATRTLGEIVAYLAAHPISTTLLGTVICELNPASTNADALCTSGTARGFSGGAAAETGPYAVRFRVSSSRTQADAATDGLGLTGGATTGVDEGALGHLGQTFIDSDTGVQFTIVDPASTLSYGYTELPGVGYSFRPGDELKFIVNPKGAHRTSKIPNIGLLGLQTKVTTTFGMAEGDTTILSTYNKAGNEPAIGEFYYATLTLGKTDSDFALKTYTNTSDIYAQYGDPVPENRASLGAKLMFLNGASIVAIRQVRKATGLAVASDSTYIDAISELAMPLPGSDRKCDVIIPMTTSAVVQQALAKHLNTQAAPRNRGEAIAFIGMPMYATPESARALAKSLKSERMILLYPGGAVLSVDINGTATEFAVDGSFLAAATAGLYLNATNDVATSLLHQKVVGFSRLIKRTADAILNLVAGDGVCILTERDGAFEVRDYLTTSTDSVLKKEPTTTTIVDYTRQRMRRALEQFIGRKGVQAVITDITITGHTLLKSLMAQDILENYRGLEVYRDASDPTVIHMSVGIKPVFSVKWIDVTFRVSTKG